MWISFVFNYVQGVKQMVAGHFMTRRQGELVCYQLGVINGILIKVVHVLVREQSRIKS